MLFEYMAFTTPFANTTTRVKEALLATGSVFFDFNIYE